MDLNEALQRIKALEQENTKLRAELEKMKKYKQLGRKRHDQTFMKTYTSFVQKYEGGLSVPEIANEGEISLRTAYRYLAYYRELKGRDRNE